MLVMEFVQILVAQCHVDLKQRVKRRRNSYKHSKSLRVKAIVHLQPLFSIVRKPSFSSC